MVRISPELVARSPAYINAVKERELDLRGNKIPAIENLGTTRDQFDVLDLSDNDILKLENFPLMNRLTTLLLSNNRCTRISEGLGQWLPKLDTIVLTNNNIQNLADIDPLGEIKTLRVLSCLNNKICALPHYRLYVIHKIPQLKVLDFRKVKQKERESAVKTFGGEKGDKLKEEIASTKTFVPGEAAGEESEGKLSKEEVAAIQDAIQNAKSLEEVTRLERALQSGVLPADLAAAMKGEVMDAAAAPLASSDIVEMDE